MAHVTNRCIMFGFVMCAIMISGCQFASRQLLTDIVHHVSDAKLNITDGCPFLYDDSHWSGHELPVDLPTFYWRPDMDTLALTALGLSMTVCAMPAGMLADLGHPRGLLGGGMLLSLAGNVLLAAFSDGDSGVPVYLIHNVLIGCAQGINLPCIYVLLSRYTPPSARQLSFATLIACYRVANFIGGVFFYFLYVEVNSWRLGQQALAVMVLLWLLLWVAHVYCTPFVNHNPSSVSWKMFLLRELNKLKCIPWRNILLSGPLLSFILATYAITRPLYQLFDAYQIFTLRLPYVGRPSDSGDISGVPSMLLAGYLADWLATNKVLSKTKVTKWMMFIGVLGSRILSAVTIPLAGCDAVRFWALSFVGLYVEGFAMPAVYSTVVSLHPRHAGLLAGVVLSAGAVYSPAVRIILRAAVFDSTSRTQMSVCSLISALFTLVFVTPFLIFGSAEEQNWKLRLKTEE